MIACLTLGLALARATPNTLTVLATVSPDRWGLETRVGPKRETLGLEPSLSPELLPLIQNFGLLFLIAPHVPSRLVVEFPVLEPVRALLDEMYRAEGKDPPVLEAPTRISGADFGRRLAARTDAARAVVAYSAGKNSIWNHLRASERLGPDNVLALHLANLNQGVGKSEADAFARQVASFPIPRARALGVRNGTTNRGFALTKARDLFVLGVAFAVAVEFGAGEVVTEGAADDLSPHFADRASTFARVEATARELGLPIRVTTAPAGELEVNRALYAARADWMNLVNNCFTPMNYKLRLRRAWAERAPTLYTRFSPYQCGSCVKCRMSLMALLLEDARLLESLDVNQLGYFVRVTRAWLAKHRRAGDLGDFLSGDVIDAFASIEARWRSRCADALDSHSPLSTR